MKDPNSMKSADFPYARLVRNFDVWLPDGKGQCQLINSYHVSGESPENVPEFLWLVRITIRDVQTPVGKTNLNLTIPIPGSTDSEVFRNLAPTVDREVDVAMEKVRQAATEQVLKTPGQIPPLPPPIGRG